MIFFFPSHFWQCRSGERPAGKVLGRRAAFNHGESGEVRLGGQPGHMLPARMMNGSGDEWVNAVSQAQLRLPPVHRVDHRRDGAGGLTSHRLACPGSGHARWCACRPDLSASGHPCIIHGPWQFLLSFLFCFLSTP